jgi:hypothetical protein
MRTHQGVPRDTTNIASPGLRPIFARQAARMKCKKSEVGDTHVHNGYRCRAGGYFHWAANGDHWAVHYEHMRSSPEDHSRRAGSEPEGAASRRLISLALAPPRLGLEIDSMPACCPRHRFARLRNDDRPGQRLRPVRARHASAADFLRSDAKRSGERSLASWSASCARMQRRAYVDNATRLLTGMTSQRSLWAVDHGLCE